MHLVYFKYKSTLKLAFLKLSYHSGRRKLQSGFTSRGRWPSTSIRREISSPTSDQLSAYLQKKYSRLLPTAYVVRDGRLCFQSVHTGGWRGGGTPSPSHNTSTPMSFLVGGTPSPSHNISTGPMSFPGGGYPSDWSQVRMGGYPMMGYSPSRDGVLPQSRSGWGEGVPPIQGWGTPLARSGRGFPPPNGVPPWIGQQMEYLIRRGRYASCVHAGGLSCFLNYL